MSKPLPGDYIREAPRPKESDIHIEQKVVDHLRETVRHAMDPANTPSMRTQTLHVLRRLCDQIEAAPDTVEFGKLVVDFQTGDVNLDSSMLMTPIKRFVGTYSVDPDVLA